MTAARAVVTGMAAWLSPSTAIAQGAADAYPAKPVRVIVGLAPGGGTGSTRFRDAKLTAVKAAAPAIPI